MATKVLKGKERLIREVKECGLELMTRAEEFVGTADTMTDFDICILFSINGSELPNISVTREYYPKATVRRITEEEKDND